MCRCRRLEKSMNGRFTSGGGLNNGLTVMELQEMILQSVVYAGFPAAIQAISSLRKVVGELDEGIG